MSVPNERLWEEKYGENLYEALIQEADKWMRWLAQYGAEPGGGVTRLLYDAAWQNARRALHARMEKLGLEVRTDRVGNTFGRLQGRDPEAGVIAVGSHLDTVRNGGRYDGAYGIIAGIIAMDVLYHAYGRPKKSLEAVAFCEEEGSRFPLAYWGSGSITGARSLEDIVGLRDADWVGFEDAMLAAGFGSPTQPEPLSTEWKAFLELHIEQGPVLEAEGTSIGIADIIVGQKRFAFRLSGKANHAGTTPMGSRRDALAGAAVMIAALEKQAEAFGQPLVATVGRIESHPNTPNVIPGEVLFTADVRHPETAVLEQFCAEMSTSFTRIADERGLQLSSSVWVDAAPVPLDSGLADTAQRCAVRRGLSCRRMPSGAGHDAQIIQAKCPSVLLFVPSRGGVSHSPEEYTAPERLADGILVLIDLMYALAYE